MATRLLYKSAGVGKMNKHLTVLSVALLAGGTLSAQPQVYAGAQGGGQAPAYPPPANSQQYDPAYGQQYDPNYGQQYDPAYGQQYDPAYDGGYADAYDPYFIPPYPGGDYLWVDGFWSPQHVWIGGYWRSPRFGVYRWSGPRYVARTYYRPYRGGFGYMSRGNFSFRSSGRFENRSFQSHGYQNNQRGGERSFQAPRGGGQSFGIARQRWWP